jgi:hypothetical protein
LVGPGKPDESAGGVSFMRFNQARSANRFLRMKSGLPLKTAKLPEIARRLLRFESEIACRTGQVISIEAYSQVFAAKSNVVILRSRLSQ